MDLIATMGEAIRKIDSVKKNDGLEAALVRDAARIAEVKPMNEATALRNAAYKVTLDWLTKQDNVPADVMEAAKVIRPSYFGLAAVGSTGDGLTPAYRKLLALGNGKLPAIGTTWTAMDLFTNYRFGATEAKNWSNELSKLPAQGQKAAWIAIDREAQTYTLVAIQDSVPDGWKGYIPARFNDGKAVQGGAK